MRLIDADELIEELTNDLMCYLFQFNSTSGATSNMWHTRKQELERVMGVIMIQPTVEE